MLARVGKAARRGRSRPLLGLWPNSPPEDIWAKMKLAWIETILVARREFHSIFVGYWRLMKCRLLP
jgi:hypothetical protein